MTSLEVYRERFGESGWRVFDHAVKESRRREQNYVSMGHVLLGLAAEDKDSFNRHLKKMRAALKLEDEPIAAEVRLEQILDYTPKYDGQGVRIGPDAIGFFRRALKIARSNGREQIEAADLLTGLLQVAPVIYAGPQRPGHG
jgi:ATP-dependent Clp protease ATP-binding subunit ClpA